MTTRQQQVYKAVVSGFSPNIHSLRHFIVTQLCACTENSENTKSKTNNGKYTSNIQFSARTLSINLTDISINPKTQCNDVQKKNTCKKSIWKIPLQ